MLSILMAVLRTFGFDDTGLAGPIQPDALKCVIGSVVLVAGAAADPIRIGVVGNAIPIVSRLVAGGAVGHLSAAYDGTANLNITSSSATDTSTVAYIVFY